MPFQEIEGIGLHQTLASRRQECHVTPARRVRENHPSIGAPGDRDQSGHIFARSRLEIELAAVPGSVNRLARALPGLSSAFQRRDLIAIAAFFQDERQRPVRIRGYFRTVFQDKVAALSRDHLLRERFPACLFLDDILSYFY